MTVSSTNTKNSYSGDGSTTVFAYTFKIFDDDDITVILRTNATGGETVQTKGTHYSVSGVGSAGGGNITFVTAPASGITVVLLRETALTQTTDYTPNDPFPASSHEDALDRLTLMLQDQQEELDRSIKVSRTNTIDSTEFTIGASDRANKVFAFDSSGNFSVTQEIGTYKGTDTTVTTSAYSARDIVKSTTPAQLDNVYIATQDSPSGISLTNTSYWQLLIDAVTAATSAANAATSATAAAASETAAAASETAAATSETNAATSASAASTSATNAATSATSASNSATAAATSETNAATSATSASTSATAAASSATAAAASATAAAASETAAATSETNAATSASSASTSATNAATSETNAATSASNAATSETNSATSASNAASSATAAAASQTAAAASAASAANSYDQFDDRYLGTKTADPTLDNDGNALVAGALYFNSVANEMRVYDGGSWIAASSAGGASLNTFEYTATAAQTTFSGADDNGATLSYTIDNIIVTLNGVVLDPDDYTATSGTSIVLNTGAALNDELNVVAFKSFTTADMVSATNGGTFGNTVNWTDNAKATFGTGSDLQIYHDGSNSYIQDAGTGNLYLQGSNQIQLQNNDGTKNFVVGNNGNGWVRLYYNNVEKLETTSTGVDVTGTVTATGDITAASFNGGGFGNRNLIINGAMQVAQRGTSSSGNTSSGYTTVDRINTVIVNQGTWTVSQSTEAPSGFVNSLKMDCTTADASPASSDQVAVEHRIEAQNLTHLKNGASDAVSTTLSFWVKSNKTGTYTLEAQGNDANRFISKTYTISSANTWEYKVINIDADTSGSGVSNDNGIGWILKWWLGVGSQWNSGTLQTTWATPVTANRVSSSQVNLADTIGNDWYITGVQLEVGEQATPFEHRSFGDELRRCQRYYQKSYNYEHAPGNTTHNGAYQFLHPSSAIREPNVRYETEMRVNPTETFYAPDSGTSGKVRNRSTNADETAVIGDTGSKGFNLSMSITANHHYGFHYTADAEL